MAKYTAANGVLLFLILFVIGWYVTNSRADAARNSLFIQSLDRAEKENGDVLKLLFDGLATVNEAEAKRVLTWLSARQYRGELPYLYLIGLYNGKSNDSARQQQGIEFLAIGMLVYRIAPQNAAIQPRFKQSRSSREQWGCKLCATLSRRNQN